MAKIKCPYSYPHRSRKDKVECICGIGGYYSRDGRFPIEFNVSADRCNFEFEHLWKAHYAGMVSSPLHDDSEALADYYRLAGRLHTKYEGSLWEWGQEDAARSLHDDAMYSQLWDGTEVSVILELHGRCGKHLVIQEFEGLCFRGLSEGDLVELLMGKENGQWLIEGKTVSKLYRYIRQCLVDFTPQKASEIVESYAADSFFYSILEPAWEKEKKDRAEHSSLVAAAKDVRYAVNALQLSEGKSVPRDEELDTALLLLFKAAGVSEEEVRD